MGYKLVPFCELFNRYRREAGFSCMGDFGRALAAEGAVYEDSMFSKWKSGQRIPRRREVLLALMRVFVKSGVIQSIEELNQLLFSAGHRSLDRYELSAMFSEQQLQTENTTFNTTEYSILTSLDFQSVAYEVVNGLVHDLGYYEKGYRIVVLTLVDEEAKVLRRIALSKTNEATRAVQACPIPFHEISIPLSSKENILLDTVHDSAVYATNTWPAMFAPVLTPDQALLNQRSAGIVSSMTYPLQVKDKTIGALIYSMTKSPEDVSYDESVYLKNFSDTVAIGVYNAMQAQQLLKG